MNKFSKFAVILYYVGVVGMLSSSSYALHNDDELDGNGKSTRQVGHTIKAMVWEREVGSLCFGFPGEGQYRPHEDPQVFTPRIKNYLEENPDVEIISFANQDRYTRELWPFLRDYLFPKLLSFKSLKILDLSGAFEATPENLDLLFRHLPQSLQFLTLHGVMGLNPEGIQVIIKYLPKLPNLKYLSLDASEFSDTEDADFDLLKEYHRGLPSEEQRRLTLCLHPHAEGDMTIIVRRLVSKSKLPAKL